MKDKKIIVGMSGGVDSSVAAYLLLEAGYDVQGVFMKNFSENIGPTFDCPWKEDRIAAYEVASHLGIPIETWDFEKEYRERVVDYMFQEYQEGRTPNPDIMCNKEIKFSVFLERAKKEGYHKIATGHYAGVEHRDGWYRLLKGKDPEKDQSYFLAALDQSQLQHVVFPLADLEKTEIRALAKKIKLPNADRPDSQGICFVGEVDMKTFLQQKIKPKKGDIVDTSGKKLGEHPGVYYFTIGQRKGLDIGGGPALYVVSKDVQNNKLIVGTKDELQLFSTEALVTDWHWIAEKRQLPLECAVKIRYRQQDQKARLVEVGDKISVSFIEKQRAVSPGQICAAYLGRELIGSGIIA